MAVDVAVERLLAVVGHPHRARGVQGEHAGVDLHREVLAPAERAAHAAQGEAHLLGRQAEARGHLVLVDVQPLGGDVEVDAALAVGHREPRLGPQEGLVLHADLVLAADHDVGRRLVVAAADAHVAQDVAARRAGAACRASRDAARAHRGPSRARRRSAARAPRTRPRSRRPRGARSRGGRRRRSPPARPGSARG